MLLIVNLAGTKAAGQTPAPVQRVLVLYSDERLLPANIIVDEAIRATFAVGTDNRIEFYTEFLDVARFPGAEQQQRQRDFFRDKYRERPPDLVIAVSGGALVFLAKHRPDLFAGVPIVYCPVAGDPHPDHLSDARIAEVPVPDSIAPTLEMMLRLHPNTRRVVVVSGNGPRDRQMADTFRQQMTGFGNRIAFTWLTNLSMEELRGELSRLPDHTVVLYLTIFQDAAGKSFTPRQALDTFAPASSAPIYGCFDTYLGHGIVGGSMVTFEQIGRKAAVACVKFSKKKSGKMCRIRFGFFEKRTIAFRLRLALPLPPNRLGTDSAPNLIGLLSRTFKNDCWWFMPQPIPSRATGSFSVRPALPY